SATLDAGTDSASPACDHEKMRRPALQGSRSSMLVQMRIGTPEGTATFAETPFVHPGSPVAQRQVEATARRATINDAARNGGAAGGSPRTVCWATGPAPWDVTALEGMTALSRPV